MKSLIIYHSSYHNNTEKIARVFAGEIEADLLSLKDARSAIVDEYDLIGFGSGVYKESMSPKLLSFASKLELEGKEVFAFSTSGVGMKYYNKHLVELLRSKGARCRGSFACKGSFVANEFSKVKMFEIFSKFAEGHPNEKDFRKAQAFIRKIIRALSSEGQV